jgi:putative transposase
MKDDTVVALPRPGASLADDPLLAVLREGARRMLMQAIEAEVEAFLAAHAELTDDWGRRRVVRNGHAPERQIQTGIGPVEVRRPRVRDRGGAAAEAPIRFTSAILPAYLRRTKNVEARQRRCRGCPGCTSRVCRRASSGKRSPPCSDRKRLVCRLRPCGG